MLFGHQKVFSELFRRFDIVFFVLIQALYVHAFINPFGFRKQGLGRSPSHFASGIEEAVLHRFFQLFLEGEKFIAILGGRDKVERFSCFFHLTLGFANHLFDLIFG